MPKKVIPKPYEEYLETLVECPYSGACCFRTHGKCALLLDTSFRDNKCHFRKIGLMEPNLYDKARKAKIPS